MKIINCTHAGCNTVGIALAMYVPAIEAIARVNKGEPVTINDLERHALCSKHAHAARSAGKLTFKLSETTKKLIQRSEQRATRIAAPEVGNVNRGLGALAKRDAKNHPPPKLDEKLLERHLMLRTLAGCTHR